MYFSTIMSTNIILVEPTMGWRMVYYLQAGHESATSFAHATFSRQWRKK
jgi:hypothetical protein